MSDEVVFEKSQDCLYPRMCKNTCMVSAIIDNEVKNAVTSDTHSLEVALNPQKYPCSHCQAIISRELGQQIVDKINQGLNLKQSGNNFK